MTGVRAVIAALRGPLNEDELIAAAKSCGDRCHEIVKAQAMAVPTVRAAMAIGIHVAAQMLSETITFGENSMEGDREDAARLRRAGLELFRDTIDELLGEPGSLDRRH